MEANFEFKKLINDKGFYAGISIDVSKTLEKGIKIVFEETSPWYPAMLFAASYFYEQYKRTNSGGIKIEVIKLNTQTIDTNSIVVFYVFIRALYTSLDFNGKEILIDDLGNLLIPK